MPKTHFFERVYYTALQADESLHSMQLALHVLQRAIPPARKGWHCHASRVRCAKVVALPRICCIAREKGGTATYPAQGARKGRYTSVSQWSSSTPSTYSRNAEQ